MKAQVVSNTVVACVVGMVATLLTAVPAVAGSFTPMTGVELDGMYVQGMSADGTVVVGEGWLATGTGGTFLWTSSDGLTMIPGVPGADWGHTDVLARDGTSVGGTAFNNLDGWQYGHVRDLADGSLHFVPTADPADGTMVGALSFDGQIVVGSVYPAVNPSFGQGIVWQRATDAVQVIQPPTGWESLGLWSVSAAGDVAVGMVSRTDPVDGHRTQGVRWQSDGTVTLLGLLEGYQHSNAQAVSADGSTIVGTSSVDDGDWSTSDVVTAVRWTQASGLTPLGALPGDDSSRATFVSADGSVIVGESYLTDTWIERPFRWTAAGGIAPLALPAGFDRGYTRGMSDDGRVIIGQIMDSTWTVEAAYVWDALHGTRLLADILTQGLGLDLGGLNLVSAQAISADGLTLAGMGRDAQDMSHGWVASLTGEIGDYNQSGDTNTEDINPFILALTNPTAYAAAYPWVFAPGIDPNGDGKINTEDINGFIAALTGGARSSATPAPEPSAMIVLCLAAAAGGMRRRR